MSWTNRPTDWAPGQYPRGSGLETILDQIESVTCPGWTDYTSSFTLAASTTNPTLGNSSLIARYRKPIDSDIVHVQIKLTIGSTFSAGSGDYQWPLPVAEASPFTGSGHGTILDLGSAFYVTNAINMSASTIIIYRDGAGTPTGSGGTGGGAWATGDYVLINYVYEAA